jgi:hypothetical protein
MIETLNTPDSHTCDKCAGLRAEMAEAINSMAAEAEQLVGTAGVRLLIWLQHGECYNSAEMAAAFEVVGFAAPMVVVRRRSDGVLGSLFFCNRPRFYYGFQPHVEPENN